jgi:hypothetical protein
VDSVNYMAKGICPECIRKGHTIHIHHHHQ